MILRPRLLRPALAADSSSLCSRCLSKFGHPAARPLRRTLAATAGRRSGTVGEAPSFPKRTFRKEYFSSHQTLTETPVKKNLLSAWSKPKRTGESETAAISTPVPSSHSDLPADTPSASTATDTQEELPHRRRKRLKEEVRTDGSEQSLPLDASAQLSAISSALPNTSLRRKLAAYLALTKPRLSVLILLSTTSAYGLFPISTLLALDPSITQLPTLSTSTLTFLYLTAGTFLSCASANTFNMILEPKFDARMSRTRNRPLVRGLVSRRGAILFAIATGLVGVGLLYVGINPTVAALSGTNILLYAFVYTPMKRVHVINTWIGAIVGAIPPMMGWVAAAGQTATTGHDTWRDMLFGEDSLGGWCLAALLFAWQFPHFNSLSHIIREEYKAAGHQMMAWVNPARNARVALRYSILMFPIAFGFWSAGVVNNWFLVSSTVANGWLVKEAYRFWKYQGAKGSARGLFWASVWQLPILLVGGLVTKRGVWDGVWRRIVGAPDDDDDEYIDEEEEAHHHRDVGISGSAASLPSVQSPA